MSEFVLHVGSPPGTRWTAHVASVLAEDGGDVRMLKVGRVWATASTATPSHLAFPRRLADWVVTGEVRLDDGDALRRTLRGLGWPHVRSDEDLVLGAVQAWGANVSAHLHGDFVVAAARVDGTAAWVVRSGSGLVPCFVSASDAMLRLSSRFDAVAHPGDDAAQLDLAAISEWLAGGVVRGPGGTFRRDVRRLRIGSVGRWTPREGWDETEWWQVPGPVTGLPRDPRGVLDAFRATLDTVLREQSASLAGGPVALALSGGLDSTLLAYRMREVVPTVRLDAHSLRFVHLPMDEEVRLAQQTAQQLGVSWRVWDVPTAAPTWAVDDHLATSPVAIRMPAVQPWPAVGRALRDAGIGALMLGEDGDVLLDPPTLADQWRSHGVAALRAFARQWARTGRRPTLGWQAARRLSRFARDARHGAPDWIASPAEPLLRPWTLRDPRHPTRPGIAWWFRSELREAWLDSTRPPFAGAPFRTLLPLLDDRVVAFAFSLPGLPWCQGKELFRRALPPAVPAALRRRPKTPLLGHVEEEVARWRRLADAVELPAWMADVGLVEPGPWYRALRSPDPDTVETAWRVLDVDQWLRSRGAVAARARPGRTASRGTVADGASDAA